jgi:cation diffusion facilitator family transporter
VLYAAKHSAEEADEEHPYGHERFETVATLGLAIILAMVGVGIVITAFDRFNNPSALSHSTLLLSIAALSIFSKEMLYWYTLKVAQTYQSTMLKANAWHHRSDALSSVVVIAGIFGSLNGYHSLDSIAAIVVQFQIVHDHKDVLRQPLQQSAWQHITRYHQITSLRTNGCHQQ